MIKILIFIFCLTTVAYADYPTHKFFKSSGDHTITAKEVDSGVEGDYCSILTIETPNKISKVLRCNGTRSESMVILEQAIKVEKRKY